VKCARDTNAWGRVASMSAARSALGAGGMACLLGRGADRWSTFRFGVADIGWGRPW
jgi:hypothetical protein